MIWSSVRSRLQRGVTTDVRFAGARGRARWTFPYSLVRASEGEPSLYLKHGGLDRLLDNAASSGGSSCENF